ncbi:hypothetical protein L486_03361 [Kwoniella mangroviensis CBS 10435]|uniref:Uncharacterized protein n=1 Tax=Kwoniella mangroviensis CBS 10435 TaxID=1331196 RepID=A0A1B9ITQ2_9TREE|nr:hypothetical protein L486_03361 [Kwoniella mangroviensis CBS 10435]
MSASSSLIGFMGSNGDSAYEQEFDSTRIPGEKITLSFRRHDDDETTRLTVPTAVSYHPSEPEARKYRFDKVNDIMLSGRGLAFGEYISKGLSSMKETQMSVTLDAPKISIYSNSKGFNDCQGQLPTEVAQELKKMGDCETIEITRFQPSAVHSGSSIPGVITTSYLFGRDLRAQSTRLHQVPDPLEQRNQASNDNHGDDDGARRRVLPLDSSKSFEDLSVVGKRKYDDLYYTFVREEKDVSLPRMTDLRQTALNMVVGLDNSEYWKNQAN